MSITDSAEKFSFLTELHLIISDFETLLEYVDPIDENLKTFSHRISSLLLRVCTAYEAVSKNILLDQKYKIPKGENMDITDYFTLNSQLKLSKYSILFGAWKSGPKELQPFIDWESTEFQPLDWYQAYNHTKHDRYNNFHEANLSNLIEALAGLFILLYAIYHEDVFNHFQKNSFYHSDDTSGYIWANDSIFSIKPPA